MNATVSTLHMSRDGVREHFEASMEQLLHVGLANVQIQREILQPSPVDDVSVVKSVPFD